jgi:hypothetical protein
MKTINKFYSLLVISFFIISCDDILEDDITGDTIQTIYPQNNQEINSNVVTFQWNALEGADKYRLQVFHENQSIALDSLVSSSSFTHPLNPGSYQWRVRGENSAYTSSYSFASNFSIIETNDLTTQQIILVNPSNELMTNNPAVIFAWQAINAAESYTFELINVTAGNSIVHQVSGLTATTFSINNTIIPDDAVYQWKIKAVNSTSETQFSNRNFSIDRVNPNQPINSSPLDNFTQSSSNAVIDFSWNIPVDTGVIQTPILYTIEFSNSVNFTTILQSSNINENSFSQSFPSEGVYYWRVVAKDGAGNTGIYSTPFKFTIE